MQHKWISLNQKNPLEWRPWSNYCGNNWTDTAWWDQWINIMMPIAGVLFSPKPLFVSCTLYIGRGQLDLYLHLLLTRWYLCSPVLYYNKLLISQCRSSAVFPYLLYPPRTVTLTATVHKGGAVERTGGLIGIAECLIIKAAESGPCLAPQMLITFLDDKLQTYSNILPFSLRCKQRAILQEVLSELR